MATAHRLDHRHFLVPPGKKIRLKDFDPAYTAGFKDKEEAQAALLEDVSGLAAAQDVLWASREYSIIIIFQALDAAGKDGTIKHVMSGVNPQGVNVHSFKAPSEEERQHHFLWRPTRALPARGVISIFNRRTTKRCSWFACIPGFWKRSGCSRTCAGKICRRCGALVTRKSTRSKRSSRASTFAS